MPPSTGVAIRQIAVNGNAGAWVEVDGTITSRYAEAIEDASANAGTQQGLQFQLPIYADDGSVSGWSGPYSVNQEPIQFGDKQALRSAHGAILAQGPNVILGIGPTNGAPICRLRSLTATPTVVNFTEFQ